MEWPVLRRVFRGLWWMISIATFVALPMTLWEFRREGYGVQYQAWFIGGIFVILSVPISVYEVAMHTEYYTRPKLQKHVIRILWMVPIYGVDAWFALRFKDARQYLDPIRECYEAFVLYSFLTYLLSFLEDELDGNVASYIEAQKPLQPHTWGLQYLLDPWPMGEKFLQNVKRGVMNYVILRPVCTVVAIITDKYGLYGDGEVNWLKSYVYLAVITNFSQMWALYCLVIFYMCMHEELKPIRPLSKFVCIKAIIFLTFWQGFLISILVKTGIIKAKASWTTYDALDIANGIQDFLICIEMFMAALAHAYAFPPRDYMDQRPTQGFFVNVRYMFDLRDVVVDVQEVLEDNARNVQSTVLTGTKKVAERASGLVKTTPKSMLQFFARNGRLPCEPLDTPHEAPLLATSERSDILPFSGSDDPRNPHMSTRDVALSPPRAAVIADEDLRHPYTSYETHSRTSSRSEGCIHDDGGSGDERVRHDTHASLLKHELSPRKKD